MECDFDCQKNKQLDILQGALYDASLKKGIEPEAYERARTAYYTLKEGQGWLHKEKEKKAVEEIEPIIDRYKHKISKLQASKTAFENRQQAIRDVESTKVGDEDEVRFIHQQVMKERNSAGVRRRILDFNGGSGYDWWAIFLDITLSLLVLIVVYFAYTYYIKSRSISVG
jgi:hypothetical protein